MDLIAVEEVNTADYPQGDCFRILNDNQKFYKKNQAFFSMFNIIQE